MARNLKVMISAMIIITIVIIVIRVGINKGVQPFKQCLSCPVRVAVTEPKLVLLINVACVHNQS